MTERIYLLAMTREIVLAHLVMTGKIFELFAKIQKDSIWQCDRLRVTLCASNNRKTSP